ncbi:annexin [Paramyrothecium foliicola]|nr:annexin [Paramyrothecium foliicola]
MVGLRLLQAQAASTSTTHLIRLVEHEGLPGGGGERSTYLLMAQPRSCGSQPSGVCWSLQVVRDSSIQVRVSALGWLNLQRSVIFGSHAKPPPQGYGQQYPPQGQYPPPQGQYPPPQGQYPPQQNYQQQHPQQGHYPPPSGSPYPPQGGQQSYGQPPPPQQQQQYGAPPPGQYGAPPQGQYGAPPPQQYGAPPPQQYGAPPPQQQYGAPPQQQYGAPPPQQYGAPPHQQQYGAPPPQQYGAPPQQYGAPQHYGPPTPASLGYGPPQIIQWDATGDAKALRSAMKGFGTDEKELIRVLSSKDPLQIEAIRTTFEKNFKRSLIEDIKDETRGDFERALIQLARGPLLNDCHELFEAMDGIGTKEVVLNDVLLSRSNADIQAIKSAYQRTFRRRLEDSLKSDLSGKVERHFMIVLAANRAEDSAPVIPQQVEEDTMNIYRATEGKMGTDEVLVSSILSGRNDNQIRAIAHTYQQKFNKNLEDVIKSEFSGHLEAALLFQLRHANDKFMHAAVLFEDAMAGVGTKDKLLIARVVRYHWDRNAMASIKAAYQQRFRRSLASAIKSETSGDYERTLLACIGEY